ncbi:peptidoglycan DD-metalloendopeptidase family protein [uncultured Actinomyces sp.]|uniref:peptidoglycan DD-metalloendopeptidase family protein n=1 Tax=uncultured Actinomyces sp. TaxID=249061 RepID=UPI0028DB76B7|nr:peptidoglycan DD-metalloendopeptidase family protein [uncultured Actinomyces sp.]
MLATTRFTADALARRPRRLRRRGVAAAMVALTVMVLGVGGGAQADDRSDAAAEQAEAEQRRAELTSSLEGVSAELGQAYLDLQNAKTALSTAQTDLATAEADLAAKEREQQTITNQLAVAQSTLTTLEQEATGSQAATQQSTSSIGQLVVSTYQGENSLTSWTYVLSSDSVEDLTQRASGVEIGSAVQESVLAAAETERVKAENRQARQKAATQRVSDLKKDADDAAAAAQTAKDTAQQRRDAVATLATQKANAASVLETQKAGLEEQQAQASADAAAAASRVAEIDAANQVALSEGSVSSVPASSIQSDSLGEGYIGHPIPGPLSVTSPFGYRIHPVTGVATGHQGVDFAASEGTPQYAAVSGTATYWNSASCGIGIDINGGYIDGHSYVITLCHLSSRTIADGQYVNRGDVVGLTGSTGYATGPHVHFQVARDGVYIDPMTLPGF